ncbi:MAG: hypothetical protein HPY61_07490 [Methanotrichaceae archaeon]|nr:hypothetical protein [Methanotrichaceae archaeon]
MICLRCGSCCIHLDVAVANPDCILADGSLDPRRPDSLIFKPSGSVCPHLQFEDGLAVCRIHHLSCYSGTPCDQFEQIGREDDVCVMGGYFRTL